MELNKHYNLRRQVKPATPAIILEPKDSIQKKAAAFVCIKCKFFGNSKAAFLKHQKNHTEYRPFRCPGCEFKGASRIALSKHKCYRHLPQKTYHIYHCQTCKYKTTTKSFLMDHIYTEHKKKSVYKCGICSFSTRHMSSLYRHENNHRNNRHYICNFCQAAFARYDNLEIHIRKHTGEKPYKCIVCKYVCSAAANFLKHKKTMQCKKNTHELSIKRCVTSKATHIQQYQVRDQRQSSYVSHIENSRTSASDLLRPEQHAISKTISLPVLLPLNLLKNWTPGQNLYEKRRKVIQFEDSNSSFQVEGVGTDRCKEKEMLVSRNVAHQTDSEIKNVESLIENPEPPLTVTISEDQSLHGKGMSNDPDKLKLCAASKVSVPVLLPQVLLENWTAGQNPYDTGKSTSFDVINFTNENKEIDGSMKTPRSNESTEHTVDIREDYIATETSSNRNTKIYSYRNVVTSARKHSDRVQEIALRLLKVKPGRSFYSERRFACPECTFTCYLEDRLLRHRLRNHF